MRLIDNKKDYIDNKVYRIFLDENNLNDSNWNIWCNQRMGIHTLINSNYLTSDIYNDIKR